MIVIFKLAFEPVELTCSPPSYLGPLASCPNLLGRILKTVFPSLAWFAIIATALTIPFGVYVGYFHMKRTGAFAAEASVAIGSNLSVYKVVLGKGKGFFLLLLFL